MLLPALTEDQKTLMILMSSNEITKASFSIYEDGMMTFTNKKSKDDHHFNCHWLEYLLLQISENLATMSGGDDVRSKFMSYSLVIHTCAVNFATGHSPIHPVELAHKTWSQLKLSRYGK